jgi:F-type H+-transporting ATPase subunit b
MAQKAANQTETVQVPPSEHGTGFPPFQKETFPSQVLWLAITFAALYFLMSRIALPRVGAIMAKRQQSVDADLTEANRLKGESDEALAAYEKSLADARSQAQALANQRREQQAAEAEAARKALDAKLNAQIADAEKAIAGRKTAALANVHGIATDAAAAIVERLIGSAPANRDIAAAVADVLKR